MSSREKTTMPVAERFVSVNGEGSRAGRLAAFVRFCGCNLTCSYCDTAWANDQSCEVEALSADEIASWVMESSVECVTLTGGEPALQPLLPTLLRALDYHAHRCDRALVVEIETNGSIDLAKLDEVRRRVGVPVCFTVDCKSPSSGMADRMLPSNYPLLRPGDAVKFVVGDQIDLQHAACVIERYDLCSRAEVFLSPVFGCIEPSEIVTFMERTKLLRARIQLQLHKYIWPNVERGV